MSPYIENFQVAVPEIIILLTAVVTLLTGLFGKKKNSSKSFYIAGFGLLLAGIASFLLLGNYKTLVFSGSFISDDVANLSKIFIYISVLFCLVYSREYLEERHVGVSDYVVLMLFSTLGMMTLVSAHSMLTVYLGLELLSLPLYAMTAIRRSESDASEAAMKYFIMGAIASGMLLYGMSLIYGLTGKLDLLEISNVLATNWQHQSDVIAFALVFIVAGIGFKLAAVPFHMWAPDVYQGAPGSVTLFLSSAPKIAALAMAFRLLTIGLVDVSIQWQHLILVLALLSTGLGNLLAISQTNIRRLLAYSAISHMGYALFGILAATTQGYAAALYYGLVYSLMSVAAFGLIILMSNRGMEVEQITDLSGLNKRNPWLAFMMLIVMFSMAGVPPTVGFFTKLLVLKALVDVQLTWVAVLGLMFAVMGAFYYLRIVKVMYFDDAITATPVVISGPEQVAFSLNCLALLYLGIFPGTLIAACMGAFSG